MTTKHSPIGKLRAQATEIVAKLKEWQPTWRNRTDDVVKVGIIMDDKIIKVEIPLETIRVTSEAGLIEYVLNLMRETGETLQ